MNESEYRLIRRLRELGVDVKNSNRVALSANESLKHFITKAMVGFILSQRGTRFITEAPVEVHGSVDYIDVFDCENGIAYEAQTVWHGSVKRAKDQLYDSPFVRDVIIIRLKKLSDDMNEMYSQLKKIVV